jgi:hypothetical protein
VRKRDKDCVFKIKCYGGKNFKELTNSHFHGRRKQSVRHDPENCDAACRACHQYLEEHKEFYKDWKLKQLGEQRYALLELRANTPQKTDEFITKLYLKSLLAELEGR